MEVKIVDGTEHLAEIKNLVIEYANFLGRDLSFQGFDEEIADFRTLRNEKAFCSRRLSKLSCREKTC